MTMEVDHSRFMEWTVRVSSLVEAMMVEAVVVTGNSFACLLIASSVLNDINASGRPELTAMKERFPFDELQNSKQHGLENKDASETEDDDEDDEDDGNDQDDDGGDEDYSGGEEGEDEEGDPDEDQEANGGAESDDGDDDDEEDGDEDEDGEDDDEEEDEEEEEEVPQPPTKKRK